MAPESPTGSANTGGGFDLNAINRNDLAVMALGVLALIASFFPFIGFSFEGFHINNNAWSSYGFVAVLLLLIAAGAIAVMTFAAKSMPSLPIGIHLVCAGLAGLATLLLILRAFTGDVSYHGASTGQHVGAKWGAYVMIIIGIAETVFAILGARESGEQMPNVQRHGAPPAAPPA